MALSTWLLFVTVAAVSILSPGPAFLMAVRNGMAGGVRRVALSSLGNISGLLVIASAAVLGLGVVLTTSEMLFMILKLCGAGYLLYLGVRQWRNPASLVVARPDTSTRGRARVFSEGVLVALSNPKAILFFTALFPQFLDPRLPLAPQFTIMVGTFMVLSFTTLMAYGSLARQIARWLGSARRTRWFNRLVGSAFIGLGVSLLRLRQPV
ncbi:LysE family translocator [Modicisalibacter xianhensis]|uniref:Threonine/homoserine/homoserine lactone efflux protein n=1 Tax=Modicisalibacter xianhensis TaxID=442341 RepID=A0A1I3F0Q3_9GAMM|nr:LysE family translocator [Halomonas xianhensis]SFI04772.1 Threonine/homoserine/homoserine lactone efflux protein [Halomonas xianhensis]